ncbi:MAG: hypothetical protein ACYDAG_16665, partial [Chloroflexota bacterium]
SGGEIERREPNPDAEELHLAYDSVYTHEGDVREELLEKWVSESQAGKRWRCWNCGRQTQRFTQLRFPTFRATLSTCDNCGTWTVWDAARDLANPRVFNLRRSFDPDVEEARPAGIPLPAAPFRPNGAQDNGAKTAPGVGFSQTFPTSAPAAQPARAPKLKPSRWDAPEVSHQPAPREPIEPERLAPPASPGAVAPLSSPPVAEVPPVEAASPASEPHADRPARRRPRSAPRGSEETAGAAAPPPKAVAQLDFGATEAVKPKTTRSRRPKAAKAADEGQAEAGAVGRPGAPDDGPTAS